MWCRLIKLARIELWTVKHTFYSMSSKVHPRGSLPYLRERRTFPVTVMRAITVVVAVTMMNKKMTVLPKPGLGAVSVNIFIKKGNFLTQVVHNTTLVFVRFYTSMSLCWSPLLHCSGG